MHNAFSQVWVLVICKQVYNRPFTKRKQKTQDYIECQCPILSVYSLAHIPGLWSALPLSASPFDVELRPPFHSSFSNMITHGAYPFSSFLRQQRIEIIFLRADSSKMPLFSLLICGQHWVLS